MAWQEMLTLSAGSHWAPAAAWPCASALHILPGEPHASRELLLSIPSSGWRTLALRGQ